MRWLFVHTNFPAQFRHLALHLSRAGDEVRAIGSSTARALSGVALETYAQPADEPAEGGPHPFARRFDAESRRAEAVLFAALALKNQGFEPDVAVAHPGWGESLPLRETFPAARLASYCEFYYRVRGADVNFDPEFRRVGADNLVRIGMRNAGTLLSLAEADLGFAPSHWQRSLFPAALQSRIAVVHDGIDTDAIAPNAATRFAVTPDLTLGPEDEVLTFVARNLEPYRGYHVFMRALPRILAARPNAQVLIVGGAGTSYGAPPPRGTTWRDVFLNEVKAELDPRRVHLLGALPYARYLQVLQVSTAHVYLTYPFVLSWSMLEAMAAGCLVIGSDTAPVQEVIRDGENGLLTAFFDRDALVERVTAALGDRARFAPLRAAARATVLERYDLTRVCLPRQLALLRGEAPVTAGPADR